jgi:hypothetical protein
MHRHSMFDRRREQLKIPFRLWLQNSCLEIPLRGRPGSGTGLEGAHSVAWNGVHTFCFVLCVYENSGRAGQWGKTCILVESCFISPSNNKLLFVKLFLWA